MSAYPVFVPPCRPKPVRTVPKGPEWLHEPKLDGWRLQAMKSGNEVTLYTRNGNARTQRFREIADAVAKLKCRSAILDGGVVAADAAGIDFYALMHRSASVSFWAFDLLELDGKDLQPLPLIERKALLRKLIDAPAGRSATCPTSMTARRCSTPAMPGEPAPNGPRQ